MSIWLKQSTAVTVKLGPFVDDTDFKTAEIALTLSQADIRLSKNGGTYAQTNNVAGATHDASGWYNIPLDTTDTNTLGVLKVFIAESGALQVWESYMVVPANVWDSYFGADKLQVHTDEMTAGIITSTVIADNAITAAKIATGAIDADAIGADAITAAKIADGAIDAATFAAGAINAAAIATDAIDADALATGAITEIQTGLASQTSLDLVAEHVDAIQERTDNLPDDPADQSLIMAAFAGIVPAPTASVVADAVWDEVLAGHLTSGTTGAALNGAGAAGDPWSTTLPGTYGPGSAGAILGMQVPFINAKTSALPADPASASAIEADFNEIDTAIASLVTDMTDLDAALAAIHAKTVNLPSDPADASVIAAEFVDVDAALAAIQAKTVNIPADPADASDIASAFAAVPNSVWNHVTRTLTSGAPPTPVDITNAVWAVVVETGVTALQSLRLANAANGGRTDGFVNGIPSTGHVRDANNTKNRVTASVDANGNRNSVVMDLS